MVTSEQAGNLSGTERAVSAGLGTGLSLLVLRSGNPILRALAVITGAALLARAAAGHCGVKAAITGQSTIGDGLREQWNRMSGRQRRPMDAEEAVEEQGSPAALQEGLAPESASMSSSSAARH